MKRINSRDKGARGERELAAYLRERGFTGAKRGQQFKGSPESPDVAGLPGHHIECKRTEILALAAAYEQATRDCGSSDAIPIVAHRRNEKPWLVILKLDDYLSLYRELLKLRELLGSDF